jgi:tetratricopeptide (TPR) repeat protein
MKKFTKKNIILALFLVFINILPTFSMTNMNFLNTQAYNMFSSGNYNSASFTYQTSLKFFPKNPVAFDGLGDIYMKQRNYYKAYLFYKKASSLNSKESVYKVHAQQAVYFAILNDIANPQAQMVNKQKIYHSIKYLESIVKYEPSNLMAISLLSDFYVLENNYNCALKCILCGIKISPNNYNLNQKAGELYACMNNNQNATNFIEKAEKIRIISEKLK